MVRKVFLVFMMMASLVWAAEMRVTEELHAVLGDLTLRKTPVRDLSGNDCALVKINTDLAPLDKIESSMTPVEVDQERPGEVWVYLSPGDRRLYFGKEGYARLIYDIPVRLQSNTVYAMTLLGPGGGFGEVDNVETLTFNLNVEGVAISRDSRAPVRANSTVSLNRLPKGKYTFTFEKEGYQTQTKTIDLDSDRTIDVTMVLGQSDAQFTAPGIVSISSEPSGAEVELNGQKVGTTPYEGSHYAGEYTLTLRRDMYYPATKTFRLSPSETLKIPIETLKPRFGHWSVKTTPSGATVYLNDKLMGRSPLSRQEIRSGNHALRVQLDQYKTYSEDFIVEDGDEKDFSLTLEPNFARLEISSAPVDGATVFIDGQQVGVTPWVSERMDAGTYRVRIEKPLWSGPTETLTIEPGKPLKKTMVMTKDFGMLIVNAPECQIYINGNLVGTGGYRENMKPGSYTVTAKRDKHTDDQLQVYVNIGQTEEITLDPKPKLGSISVFAVEKRDPSKKIGGAEIHIDGKDSGKKTPSVLEMLYGDYNVLLSHPDYLPISQNVKVEEGSSRNVTFQLDTYAGSQQAKRNFWKTQGWIGLAATALATGGGLYCNMQSDSKYDDYENATGTSEADSKMDDVKRFEDYRDYCMYTASGLAIYTAFSWIKTLMYNE